MSASDLGQFIEQYHRALDAFVQGDPEPVQQLFSRRDDVTLANPLGPAVRGWSQVAEATGRAASQFREGEPVLFEIISEYATEDLAYNLELEKVPGEDVLELDIPSEIIESFEWVEERNSYREFLVPASIVNQYPVRHWGDVYDHFESGDTVR